MKKILALILTCATVLFCFAACGPKAAIDIAPHDFNTPDSYKYTYTIVSYDDVEDKYITEKYICGRDADDNFYYDDGEEKRVYIGKSEDSYDEYILDGSTHEQGKTGMRWIDAFAAQDKYIEYANDYVTDRDGTYQVIEKDELSFPDELRSSELLCLDSERFEYFVVTCGNDIFETAIEKETGICYYVYSKDDHGSGKNYYFYISEQTVPSTEKYASLISE